MHKNVNSKRNMFYFIYWIYIPKMLYYKKGGDYMEIIVQGQTQFADVCSAVGGGCRCVQFTLTGGCNYLPPCSFWGGGCFTVSCAPLISNTVKQE